MDTGRVQTNAYTPFDSLKPIRVFRQGFCDGCQTWVELSVALKTILVWMKSCQQRKHKLGHFIYTCCARQFISVCLCLNACVNERICVCARLRVRACPCVCVSVHACVRTLVCAFAHACVCVRAHACVCAHARCYQSSGQLLHPDHNQSRAGWLAVHSCIAHSLVLLSPSGYTRKNNVFNYITCSRRFYPKWLSTGEIINEIQCVGRMRNTQA